MSGVVFYTTAEGRDRIERRVSGETVWRSLNQMVDLFERDKSVISRYINNELKDGELDAGLVAAHYAAQFRHWASTVLRDILALSEGYDPKSKAIDTFYATIQNKMFYAVSGFTAKAELAADAALSALEELQAIAKQNGKTLNND